MQPWILDLPGEDPLEKVRSWIPWRRFDPGSPGEDPLEKGMQPWILDLPGEDPLEKGMQPISGFLPGESPPTEEPRGLWSIGSQ